eukprot:1583328-Rhodomonas_salina.1
MEHTRRVHCDAACAGAAAPAAFCFPHLLEGKLCRRSHGSRVLDSGPHVSNIPWSDEKSDASAQGHWVGFLAIREAREITSRDHMQQWNVGTSSVGEETAGRRGQVAARSVVAVCAAKFGREPAAIEEGL